MSEQKVALITGAGGNLGSALSALLTGRGWRVIAVDRDAETLRKRLAESGVTAPHLVLAAPDLADPAQADALIAQCGDRIDAVAHTVGGFAWAAIADSGADLFDRMFRMNLLTTVNLFRAVWPRMQAAGGSLVAIGAGAAIKAPTGMSAYAASKAGVLRLIESLADEGKAVGIRANAVMPSIIDTPQNRAAMPDADTSKWVTAQQVSEAIAFLLSEAASGVTGAAIPITGRG